MKSSHSRSSLQRTILFCVYKPAISDTWLLNDARYHSHEFTGTESVTTGESLFLHPWRYGLRPFWARVYASGPMPITLAARSPASCGRKDTVEGVGNGNRGKYGKWPFCYSVLANAHFPQLPPQQSPWAEIGGKYPSALLASRGSRCGRWPLNRFPYPPYFP
jgi:hypothetical protein